MKKMVAKKEVKKVNAVKPVVKAVAAVVAKPAAKVAVKPAAKVLAKPVAKPAALVKSAPAAVAKPVEKKAVVVPAKPVVAKKAPAKVVEKKTTSRKVELTVEAHEGSQVFVAGTFNDWNPSNYPMKQASKGIFSVTLNLEPGRYEYKFVVNGEWLFDKNCTEWVADPFGAMNSVIEI